MANFKQIKLITISWKTIPRTALLIGPPEGHGPCQQASMTSHRQCGTAEGHAVDCRHGGDEGASHSPGGKAGCQLNGSEISASQRGTGSPEGPWPSTSGSCREDSMARPWATALHLWVHSTQLAVMSLLKCLWTTAGAKAATDVPALLRWLSFNRSAALATAWHLEAEERVLVPALSCCNRGVALEWIRAFQHRAHKSCAAPETSHSATSNRTTKMLKLRHYDLEKPRKWNFFHSKGLKRDQWCLCEIPGMDKFGKLVTEYLTWSQLTVWGNKILQED